MEVVVLPVPEIGAPSDEVEEVPHKPVYPRTLGISPVESVVHHVKRERVKSHPERDGREYQPPDREPREYQKPIRARYPQYR